MQKIVSEYTPFCQATLELALLSEIYNVLCRVLADIYRLTTPRSRLILRLIQCAESRFCP